MAVQIYGKFRIDRDGILGSYASILDPLLKFQFGALDMSMSIVSAPTVRTWARDLED